MSIISWNCRGLGNVKAVPTIKSLIYVTQLVLIITFLLIELDEAVG